MEGGFLQTVPHIVTFVSLCPTPSAASRVDGVLPGADPVGGGGCGGAFHPGSPRRRREPRADGDLPHAAG